jgi:hypothetical protein
MGSCHERSFSGGGEVELPETLHYKELRVKHPSTIRRFAKVQFEFVVGLRSPKELNAIRPLTYDFGNHVESLITHVRRAAQRFACEETPRRRRP